MAAASIDDLLEEFGSEPFTLADFRRERAQLERRFLMTYGIHAVDIDDVVRRGDLHSTELVEQWVALHALAPYVGARDRPPRPPIEAPETHAGRESGLFVFGDSRRRYVGAYTEGGG
jgi:hypothetical protein